MKHGKKVLRGGDTTRWAASFVLAMICLRALIPVGFMLAPVDGRLDLVVCDSAAPGPAHHHSDHGRSHGGHDQPGHPHASGDPTTCPFALSAGPAPLPALPIVPASPIAGPAVLATQVAQTYLHFGPSRQQSPRGPPLLA